MSERLRYRARRRGQAKSDAHGPGVGYLPTTRRFDAGLAGKEDSGGWNAPPLSSHHQGGLLLAALLAVGRGSACAQSFNRTKSSTEASHSLQLCPGPPAGQLGECSSHGLERTPPQCGHPTTSSRSKSSVTGSEPTAQVPHLPGDRVHPGRRPVSALPIRGKRR